MTRTDMRHQWVSRVLGNKLIDPDAVMEPFAREVLARAAEAGEPVVLIMGQSKLSDRHQVLMLALRHGERVLPLAWRVEATEGPIGFAVQRDLLEAVVPWLPGGVPVCLMADRFYGTADLISLCQGMGKRKRKDANTQAPPTSRRGGDAAACARSTPTRRQQMSSVGLSDDGCLLIAQLVSRSSLVSDDAPQA